MNAGRFFSMFWRSDNGAMMFSVGNPRCSRYSSNLVVSVERRPVSALTVYRYSFIESLFRSMGSRG